MHKKTKFNVMQSFVYKVNRCIVSCLSVFSKQYKDAAKWCPSGVSANLRYQVGYLRGYEMSCIVSYDSLIRPGYRIACELTIPEREGALVLKTHHNCSIRSAYKKIHKAALDGMCCYSRSRKGGGGLDTLLDSITYMRDQCDVLQSMRGYRCVWLFSRCDEMNNIEYYVPFDIKHCDLLIDLVESQYNNSTIDFVVSKLV